MNISPPSSDSSRLSIGKPTFRLAGKCRAEVPGLSKGSTDMAAAERLIDSGMARVRAGQLIEGLSHYTDALSCLSCDLLQRSRDYPAISDTERPSKRRKTSKYDVAVDTMIFPELLGETYQSSEYDEGMNIYPPPLPLSAAEEDLMYARAIVLCNMATLNVALNRFETAMLCFKRGLEYTLIDHKSCTTTHALTAHCLHGLGNLYFKCGRIETSIKCYEKVTEVYEATDCTDSLDMASALNCLGVLQFHRNRCDVDTAVEFFQRALSIQRSHLGAVHFIAATTLNNLGRVLCIGSRYDDALKAYEEAFRIRVSTLGYQHLDVAATAYNIGQTYQQQKNLDQALEYYQHFIHIATRELGHLHMDVALTLKCIAQIHQEYRRFDKALTVYRMALHAAYNCSGRHAEVATILNKIGNIYFEQGELEKACKAYEIGLQVERTNLNDNHPNIAVTLCNLGLILRRKGELMAALKRYKEALAVQRQCFGDNDLRIATTFSNMGHIHLQMRDYAMALDSFQQAIRIRRNIATDDDLEVASTLNSVGLVLFKMGISKLALRTFSECLRVRRKLLDEDDLDIAVPVYNMGTTYHSMGLEEEALECFREVLRIEKLNQGEDIPSTLSTLAELYEALGDRAMAVSCYEEILKNLDKNDVNDEPVVVRTLMALASLYVRRGDAKQVLNFSVEAVRVRQRHSKGYEDLRLNGFFLFDLCKICPGAAPAA